MSLVEEVYRLKPEQVKELCGLLLEAALVYEVTGSGWRKVIRKARNKKFGRQRKILEAIEKLSDSAFDNVSKQLAESTRDL